MIKHNLYIFLRNILTNKFEIIWQIFIVNTVDKSSLQYHLLRQQVALGIRTVRTKGNTNFMKVAKRQDIPVSIADNRLVQ